MVIALAGLRYAAAGLTRVSAVAALCARGGCRTTLPPRFTIYAGSMNVLRVSTEHILLVHGLVHFPHALL